MMNEYLEDPRIEYHVECLGGTCIVCDGFQTCGHLVFFKTGGCAYARRTAIDRIDVILVRQGVVTQITTYTRKRQ